MELDEMLHVDRCRDQGPSIRKSCANWANYMFHGLIQSRDIRGRHVLSTDTMEVEAYEYGLMPA